jgi:hypothetical protein
MSPTKSSAFKVVEPVHKEIMSSQEKHAKWSSFQSKRDFMVNNQIVISILLS